MENITFLIDGLNFYYSVISVEKNTGLKAKWFNYLSLCEFYKNEISKKLNKEFKIEKIFYFTALIIRTFTMGEEEYNIHKNNQLVYLRVLEDLGLKVEKSKFKKRDMECPKCGLKYYKPTEKQTDVKIAIKIFEVFYKKISDAIVIISGDTDLVPAIRTAKNIFNNIKIGVIIPYGNRSEELKSVSDFCYSIPSHKYINHLLPDPYKLRTEKVIHNGSIK
ncbi:MAG TPA: NYN domain-containing protein [bacterium]|nr:NYN domain-containing protein [bacterium]